MKWLQSLNHIYIDPKRCPETLAEFATYEYERDKGKRDDVKLPVNYFPNDDPEQRPLLSWRSHSINLYSNWLNYYVYQMTPYDVSTIGK